MNTKNVYISIPHITPALEIRCTRPAVASYLEHLFFPYINYDPERNDYSQISFVDCDNGKILVYDEYSNGVEVESIIRYIESFIIKNACAINGHIMLHGGAISRNGKAIAIVGNSFAGKSTATAYLCSREFEYVTDDKLLINTNTLEVIPFQRKIMLRPDAVGLLSGKYNTKLDTCNLKLRGIERNCYTPSLCVTHPTYLKKIIILNRQSNCDFAAEDIEYSDGVKRLLMYGMNAKNYKHVDRYRKIAKCGVSEINYSDLCDLENYLLEEIK